MTDFNKVAKLELVSGLMTIGHSLTEYLMRNPEALSQYVKFMEENSATFDVKVEPGEGMTVEDAVKEDMLRANKAFMMLYQSSERMLTLEVLGQVFGTWLITGDEN